MATAERLVGKRARYPVDRRFVVEKFDK